MIENLPLPASVNGAATLGALAIAVLICIRKWRTSPRAALILFAVYLVGLAAVTTGQNPSGDGTPAGSFERIHMDPGIEVALAFYYNVPYMYAQFALNVALFIPFGILMPIVEPRMCTWWKVLLLGAGISLGIELAQWLSPGSNRLFDLDDIFCNVLGCAAGYAIVCLTRRPLRRQLLLPAAILVVAAVFFVRPLVHGPLEYHMPDSGYRLPSGVIAGPELQPLEMVTMPVLEIEPGTHTYLVDQMDGTGTLSPDILKAELPYVEQLDAELSSGTVTDAIWRADHGVMIDARQIYPTRYIGRLPEVTVMAADLRYVLNKDGTRLLPAWVLTAEVTGYDPTGWFANERGESLGPDPGDIAAGNKRISVIVPF